MAHNANQWQCLNKLKWYNDTKQNLQDFIVERVFNV